ncbi:MAG: NirD/YgiW/YdeI family stress tolerance protein [Pseudomonadota bacterium]|nr:NirD/YgiW/YdeI family stress tolerance protein [Pseudomonadota bacterium]
MRELGCSGRLAALRRFSMVVACAAALQSSPAQAQFLGSHDTATTVADARAAPVGSRVALTGSLVDEIRRAQYLFKDGSGTIRVRIEHEFWRGREVTTKTVIGLRGKIQNDVRGRFVDVYYFSVLD